MSTARWAIECIAACKLAVQSTDLRELIHIQRQLKRMQTNPSHYFKFSELDFKFHATMAELAGFHPVVEILRKIYTRTLIGVPELEIAMRMPRIIREHDAVISAIKSGDALKLSSAIKEHLYGFITSLDTLRPKEQSGIRAIVSTMRKSRGRQHAAIKLVITKVTLDQDFEGGHSIAQRREVPRRLRQTGPMSAILLEAKAPPSVWTVVDYSQTEELKNYMEELSDGAHCLTCTQGVDSYLLPDPMVEWSERSRLLGLGWTEEKMQPRVEGWMKYVDEQRRARARSNSTHQIICRDKFFATAFAAEPDWIDPVAKTLTELDEHAAIGLVSSAQWRDLDNFLRKTIELPAWDKVSVTKSLAMLRPTREQFWFTHDRHTVDRLRKALDKSTLWIAGGFSVDKNISPATMSEATKRAIERLTYIAQRLSPSMKKPV